MATVQRSASEIAWSIKKQSAFGTPVEEADLTKHLKLADPLIINENAEHWTDRGMVGSGHDWETQRGKIRQFVQLEIPMQPLPVDFLGYLIAMFFSDETESIIEAGKVYGHTAKFLPLGTRPEAYQTTLAILEDANDYGVQDLAVRSLTIRGEGRNRLEASASLTGTKIGDLTAYTFPDAAALRYLYNYAGKFEIDSDIRAQLRSFELTLESGINEELAWQKAAAEANRIYPAVWPYTPERNMSLSLRILAAAADLATFRAAQQLGTEAAVVVSCLGALITGSEPEDHDEVEITIPKAVYNGVDYGYEEGLLHIELDIEGHHDSTGELNSPIKILTTEGTIPEYFAT